MIREVIETVLNDRVVWGQLCRLFIREEFSSQFKSCDGVK